MGLVLHYFVLGWEGGGFAEEEEASQRFRDSFGVFIYNQLEELSSITTYGFYSEQDTNEKKNLFLIAYIVNIGYDCRMDDNFGNFALQLFCALCNTLHMDSK